MQNLNVCDNLADHMVGSVYAKARGPHTSTRTRICSSCSACCRWPIMCSRPGRATCASSVRKVPELTCLVRSCGARAAHARIASGSAGSALEALRGAVSHAYQAGVIRKSGAQKRTPGRDRARFRIGTRRRARRRACQAPSDQTCIGFRPGSNPAGARAVLRRDCGRARAAGRGGHSVFNCA